MPYCTISDTEYLSYNCTLYDFRYLCVGEGKRISSTMFSSKMQQWNYDYFDCWWGLRDFNQGLINISREFISPEYSYIQAGNILADSADRSTGVDHVYPYINQGVVPRFSNDIMCTNRWLGDQWHSVLGIGPSPPPEAIRINRKNISNGTIIQSILHQVKNTTEESLKSFFSGQFTEILNDAICTAFVKQRHYTQHDQTTGDVFPHRSSLTNEFHIGNSGA